MTAFWDNLKKSVRTWGSVAAEKAEELGKAAATKTEELTKISKVRLELHQLQRELDKHFASFGKSVFESVENDNVTNFAGNEQFFSQINRVKELISKIKQKQVRIEEIKAEYETVPETPDEPEETAQKTSSSKSAKSSKSTKESKSDT